MLVEPGLEQPAIVLGRADMQLSTEPQVFVPVATPGVDAPGSLLRTDKVVSLRLRRLRESTLPSVAQALDQLIKQLDRS